jgi:hypothetical protein
MTKKSVAQCSVEGCEGKCFGKGLCHRCHNREWRRKRFDSNSRHDIGNGTTPEERFWDRIEKQGVDECWEWQRKVNSNGYGSVALVLPDGRPLRGAHRLAYYYTYGIVPQLCILHSCDNTRCCNPKHLQEGTVQDNNADKVAKGRQARGEKQSNSKLLDKDIPILRQRFSDGEQIKVLAVEYGISHSAMWKVVTKRSYRHI